MFSNIRNSFNFNKGERVGILLVIALIIIVLAYPYCIKISNPGNEAEFALFASEIVQFENSIKHSADSVLQLRKSDFQQMDRAMAENKITPFPFNPNELTKAEWTKMGLKEWQVKVIINYQAKGGKFYKKEDFKRMYCISPSEYDLLEPYIFIPERKTEYAISKPDTKPREIKPKILVELNSADSVTLLSLYGIGPSFAKRIIKYRTLLGGFYTKAQLLEVFGFDQEKFNQMEARCEVNPDLIQKININKAKTDELKKHPYFDFYTAKAIVDQRIVLGKYTSLQQLKAIPLIHEELYNKISHYLLIE